MPPIIEAVDWVNSLLISGSADQITTIKSLVAKLDLSNEAYSKLKVYRLHNAEAAVAGEVLQSLVSGSPLTKGDATTTPGGSAGNAELKISADKNTNSLIVMADQEKLKQIDEFVAMIDQAQDQVFVEALVLETSLSNSKEFGVEWASGAKVGDGFTSFGYTKTSGSNLNNYISDVSTMPGGFSMGVLGNLISYGGQTFPTIAALINFTKGSSDFNLISAPQVMTLDNSEAEIFVGENRPFKKGESSTSGDSVVASYDYKDVGIKLKITPHVNKGLIRLDLLQTYNTVSTTAGTLELPVTNDRSTKTKILMADGSTMVIGGLIQSDQSRSQNAVPYLSDLPVLGWLFKQQTKSSTKRTLMIFISARIIKTTEQLEALSQAKLEKYRTQRQRFNSYIESEFNTYKKSDSQAEPKKAQEATPSEN